VQRGVTLVPTAAVQRGLQGPFVYVVKPDHTAEVRPVTLGDNDGD
jgi:multidrug efflux system membrane fusion protein